MLEFIRKYVYYFIGAALLIIGIQSYFIWFRPRSDAWDLIPNSALAVVESSQLQYALFDEKNQNANLIADVPFFFDAKNQLDIILQTSENQEINKKFLTAKRVTFSLHPENKQNLEYIIYIPINSFSEEPFLRNLEKPDPNKIHTFGSKFGGYRVTEVQKSNKESLFHYFIHQNHLICSRSLVLLQDVIRRINDKTPSIGKNPFTVTRQGIAHIYFRKDQLRNHADLLKNQLNVPNLVTYFMNIMPPNADLVIEPSSESHLVKGYIYSTIRTQKPFVGVFDGQISKGILAKNLIPQNTAILYHLGFHNNQKLQKAFGEYTRLYEKDIKALRDSAQQFWGVNINDLYSTLKDEAILCEIQSASNILSSKVLLLKTSEITDALTILDEFANKTAVRESPRPVENDYLNRKYRKLILNEFPAMLFGSAFYGFQNSCYYTFIDDYIVIANTKETMTDYLDQHSEGKVWSKTNNSFLQKLNPKAQISTIVVPQGIWKNIYHSLDNNRWQPSLLKHENRFKELRFIGLQTFVNNAEFGTKVLLEKIPKTQKAAIFNKFFLQDSLVLTNPIATQPYIIPNRFTQADEIITQSTDNQLYLLNSKAQIISRDTIAQPLYGRLTPTDYFQNGLLQYLVNSPNYLYVFKRDLQKGLEAYIPAVPVLGGIRAVSVENQKIYVGDDDGNIFINDETTQAVTRVNARKFKRIISIQPLQFKGENLLFVLQENGELFLIRESGTIYKNFAAIVGSGQARGLILDKISSVPTATVITKNGEVERYNVLGEKIYTFQIPKTEGESYFEVIFDQSQKDYVIAERTLTDVFILDKQFKKSFKITKTNTQKIRLQYFDLGNDLKFIVGFDGQSNSIFDLNGNQIGGNEKSIPASAFPNLSYLENYNKLIIYNPNKTHFEIWTVKIK